MDTAPVVKDQAAADIPAKHLQQLISRPHSTLQANTIHQVLLIINPATPATKPAVTLPVIMIRHTTARVTRVAIVLMALPCHRSTVKQVRFLQAVMGNTTLRLNLRMRATANRISPTAVTLVVSKVLPSRARLAGNTAQELLARRVMASKTLPIPDSLRIPAIARTRAKGSSIRTRRRTPHTQAHKVSIITTMVLHHLDPHNLVSNTLFRVNTHRLLTAMAIPVKVTVLQEDKGMGSNPSKGATGSKADSTEVRGHLQRQAGVVSLLGLIGHH